MTELGNYDDDDDEYETPAQAVTRLRAANGTVVVELPPTDPESEIITEYCAFNQADYWEPLFASGEIHEALRHMLDEPLFTSNNLRSAVRFADMRNDERARADKMGIYGPVVVRTRTVTYTPYRDVSFEELDRVRGR